MFRQHAAYLTAAMCFDNFVRSMLKSAKIYGLLANDRRPMGALDGATS